MSNARSLGYNNYLNPHFGVLFSSIRQSDDGRSTLFASNNT